MKKSFAFGLYGVVALSLSATPAFAGELVHSKSDRLTLRPTTSLLADNVVVTPGGAAPAQTAAPQAAPPAAAAPAQQQTAVVDAPRTNKVVHTDVQAPRNYMATVAVSALMGGLVGTLVGGSIYFLGDRNDPQNIAYWAAGGVLLGTGVGVVQIMVQETRASNATALNKLPSDPAPTLRLALFRATF